MERDLRGMTIAGRYRIERLLARGGMGTAYIAVDERAFERRVVIKVPDALRSDDARARFVNEARQIIGLQHPHIVTALDVGTVDDDTTPFIVMAYMGGGDLGQRIAASGGVQSPEEVASWLVDIAGALDFVHEHHVLHRDVKPGNILFDRPGPSAEPFLADFGIAKALEGEMMVHTHTGEHLGSPKYMPPETWFGTPGPAFDQYSLACVAYEALTGALPHTADNALALAMEKNAKPARPLTEVAPHVPAEAAAALMRGLEKDPAHRFQSCCELAHAFAAGLIASTTHSQAGAVDGHASAERRDARRAPAGPASAAAAEPLTVSDLQVRPTAARLRWIRTLAVTGAICAFVLAATAGTVVTGFYTIPFVIAIPIVYATVSIAWAIRHLRVATLRALSVFVGAAMAAVLLAVIPLDATGHFDLLTGFGPAKDPNRFPIVVPIAVLLVGMAFVIGRIQNRAARDANALLAIQVPIFAQCVWLAGRLPPSILTPLIVISGVGLSMVAIGVLFVAPRTAILLDEEIPATAATPLSRVFVGFSVAAGLSGMAVPVMLSSPVDLRTAFFLAAGVLPLTVFAVLHQRTRGVLSPTTRGIAYGWALLVAGLVGGLSGFVTFALVGLGTLHVPEQFFRVGVVTFSALPSAVVAFGLAYLISRHRRRWHALAPLVALHLAWIGSGAMLIPIAVVGLLSDTQKNGKTPGVLFLLSVAASIAAVVSARSSAHRAVGTATISRGEVSNVHAPN